MYRVRYVWTTFSSYVEILVFDFLFSVRFAVVGHIEIHNIIYQFAFKRRVPDQCRRRRYTVDNPFDACVRLKSRSPRDDSKSRTV